MQYKNISASGEVIGTRASLLGYSVAAGGSAVIVNFRSDDITGTIICQVKVAANSGETVVFPRALGIDTAIYVEFNSGTPSNVTVFWE